MGYMRDNKNLESNIWNKEGFDMCGVGKKGKFIAKIKHIKRCILWSKQRIVRGYADIDRWNMFSYLQTLIPDMLQDLRDNRMGSPGYLGENYTNDVGILVNDACHEKWDKILDKMIYLWREAREETKEIHDLHRAEERKQEEYREQCKNEAFDMLKVYFYSLWD